MTIACATNDGKCFVNTHFGDAERYNIYELSEKGCVFIKTLENNTEPEEEHAAPKKAKGIVKLLKAHDVQIGVSKQFGPNIKRVSKHFLPVLISEDTISSVLTVLAARYGEIVSIMNDEEQGFIRVKDEDMAFIPIQKES